MDNIDVEILNILQDHGKTTNADIAKAVGMAPSGVLERVRKLEKKGIIEGYYTKLNEKSVDLSQLAFIFIKTNTVNWRDDVAQQLSKISFVQEVHEIVGESDYLVKVRVRDAEHLSDLLKESFAPIEDILYTNTIMVVRSPKETLSMVIPTSNQKARKKRKRKINA